ncbi:MAG: TOBE domain-containing protein, partial [Porticoccaceae bacterium]
DAEQGLPGTLVERNYKGSTVDALIRLDDGQDVLANRFFDADDPEFDYRLGDTVKISWVKDSEWLLPADA